MCLCAADGQRRCRTTFSAAFETGALYQTPHASVIFNVFMNVGLYALFTLVCFCSARPPRRLCDAVNRRVADWGPLRRSPPLLRRSATVRRLSREQTVAVCFCGAAKTTSLGIPLATAMWAQSDDLTRALIQIPVLLYTIEQVFMAQILVYVFKWYLRRAAKAEETSATDEEEGGGGVSGVGEVMGQRDGERGDGAGGASSGTFGAEGREEGWGAGRAR